ncbi:hypothetical protein COV53_04760 [Candidatus Gottesmanbacteria bacterium CG11_big_fil_rev_8_21_14_0_20_37_11]|uniref:DUF916 domain-containing protein n=3 Tax=Candidatus Gottesmaniibacteriota TaxID=1752720 RepID=A0A2M7RRX2_9BACT|nr:MAG: hypothetical protein AUJ73_04620 [Candidatus Gottesmanbacteria bacterium CG1_02_37_22]PIP32427.1 MAG: hypothetical protein COX23_04780 [Candidatus Gottesmanbacteria bacterium CG23_combo_of_CG06-09_8_20_14_all_37_19]PIR08097.1 MAG: hypothetical protein COV53_04760 [Candidatus Gottesmanbacteria bacterium CG11_big_fil_rev_8_21_14_0_20_37_11]PIZ03026.1 MAG: hypothetical protein COY59_01650 [Candidatus Gottesmanbacteria bacterium CG_4_10_14_0_8_um_filter_37_24]
MIYKNTGLSSFFSFKTGLLPLVFPLFFFFLLTSTKGAIAQTMSLSISPPLLEVIIKPGKSITQVYKVVNSGDPIILTPKLVELDENGIKSNPDFKRDEWISLINQDVSFDTPLLLNTGAEKQYILRVNPPKDLEEKDYYRILLFSSTPNPPANISQSAIRQNIGSILLISVTSTGMLNRSAQITKFDLPKILDSFDALNAIIEIKNTGASFFRPIGQINLTGPIGKASFDIAPNILLSGQKRILFEKNLTPFSLENKTLNLPGFFLGKYQLEVKFTLDEGNIVVSGSKVFYALPWKIACVILLVLVMTILIIKKRRKK